MIEALLKLAYALMRETGSAPLYIGLTKAQGGRLILEMGALHFPKQEDADRFLNGAAPIVFNTSGGSITLRVDA